jgi:hypothetical protein
MTDGFPEFRRAEADTVMFASVKAMKPADALVEASRDLADPALASQGRGPAQPPAPRARRRWLSRAVLLLIMLVQTVLTLRTHNTAFEDEALYLYTGHLEIGHWLYGAALQGDYPAYFSGAPFLYPVLGALADNVGGLAAARGLSLIEMLAATGLVYTMSRRLFNERAGLCAAVIFSVAEPTLFFGNLATYDATALCLLAVAAWLVVRTAAFRWPGYLLAAPLLVLAVATKYAALLFVPTVILLAGLAAAPRLGRKALIAPAVLGLTTAGLLGGALYLAGPAYRTGITAAALDRFQDPGSVFSLLWGTAKWVGLPLALAVVGALAYASRPITERGEEVAADGGRLRRAMLGAVLAGNALLALAEPIRIHSFMSLQKQAGFGLLLAAPIVGVGLARVVGDHFRRAQIGVAIWGTMLVIGMTGASSLFSAWPNSTAYVAGIAGHLWPGARYLVEGDAVPIYYLRGRADAQPGQFTSTQHFRYVNEQGQVLTGDAGYVAAIEGGYFHLIAFNFETTPAADSVIARTLAADPDYRLAAVIPNGNDTAGQFIWVKSSAP